MSGIYRDKERRRLCVLNSVKKHYEKNADKVKLYRKKLYAYQTECRRLMNILID